MTQEETDVVVVGAGLAGLAAARFLHQFGKHVTVLESTGRVGGRLSTDHMDGFTLDHGFQLYNPAYPEGARLLDYEALALQPLPPGLAVRSGKGLGVMADPRRDPLTALRSIANDVAPWPALVRLGLYFARCTAWDVARLERLPDVSSRDALKDAGIRDDVIDRLVRPFLAGVFLEDGLTTSRRFMDLVIRSMLRGTPSLPAKGMSAIPEQLAAGLPGSCIRLGARALEITPGRVRTADAEFRARHVVVAVDPHAVSSLLPVPTVETVGVTTWYHCAPAGDVAAGPRHLVVDADRRGPLVNSIALSRGAPSYAPDGTVLFASSALGTSDHDDADIRRHISRLHGLDASRWPEVARYAIPHALPRQRAPFAVRKPVALQGDLKGIFIAGDHIDTASIQGALVSGRRAAKAVLAQMGTGADPASSDS